MDRPLSTLLTLAIVLTACANAPAGSLSSATATTSTEPTTPATYATTTDPTAPPTTDLTTTGTIAPSASTSQPTTTTLANAIALLPTLPDGRPTTFIGVTSEYVAVEVTTATGANVHEFGQTGTREEVETAVELGPNVITAS